ncbi:MAG: hemolysin family protein [Lentisphaeria bacterium]|nr:hemolysin family protein [Lentisphaeria bacterium]
MTLLFIYLGISLGFSFLCSFLESILLSITPSYVASLKSDKSKGANALRESQDKLDNSLSAILTLNTFAHTMGAAGVGSQVQKLTQNSENSGLIETIVAVLLTLAILYFSEVIPKSLGAKYWQKWAKTCSRFIQLLVTLTKPLVIISSLMTSRIGGGHKQKVSRDEVAAMAELGERDGSLNTQEGDVIENVLKLKEVRAHDILTPRTVVFGLEQNTTVTAAMKEKQLKTFSRIPIFDQDIDHIVGYVLQQHIFEAELQGHNDMEIGKLVKPLHQVNEALPVLNLLNRFIKRQEHIFLVVDKYGQTCGVVTLEDVIETLLGNEIVDELDEVVDYQQLAKEKFKTKMKL